ncbi:MAG: hypothetical protein ACI3XR_06145 [Eubacteriales bacterium]
MKRSVRLSFLLALMLLVCLSGLSIPQWVFGAENGTETSESESPSEDSDIQDAVGQAESDFWASVPDGVRDLLPDDTDPASIATAVDGSDLLNWIGKLIRNGAGQALTFFCLLLALVLLSTLAERIGSTLTSGGSAIFCWISSLCIGLLLYRTLFGLLSDVQNCLDEINAFMTSMGTVLSALYLAGGNAIASGVQMGWLALLLTLTEKLSYYLLLPILELSFSASLITALTGNVNLRPFAKSLRNLTTGLLTLCMTVLSVILSFQTTLAAASDSLSMRAMKAAAGNVPIIGGMVAESLRTLSTGLSAVKGTVGTVGVLVILLLSLTPLVTLLLMRFALNLAGSVAEAVGNERLSPMLADTAAMMGYLMAMLALFDLLFIFCLSVFVKSTAALG